MSNPQWMLGCLMKDRIEGLNAAARAAALQSTGLHQAAAPMDTMSVPEPRRRAINAVRAMPESSRARPGGSGTAPTEYVKAPVFVRFHWPTKVARLALFRPTVPLRVHW